MTEKATKVLENNDLSWKSFEFAESEASLFSVSWDLLI